MSDNLRAMLHRVVSAVCALLKQQPKTPAELAYSAGFDARDDAPCPYVERLLVQEFWAGREAMREAEKWDW